MSRGKVMDGLLGFCIGDSLGLPVDHRHREELREHPVRDMQGYGAYFQPPGTWSEESALTFCAAESLCDGFDMLDMASRFCRWFYEGYWSPHGVVFRVDPENQEAIVRMHHGTNPMEAGSAGEEDNGNGSLTRILPLAYSLKTYLWKTVSPSFIRSQPSLTVIPAPTLPAASMWNSLAIS